MNIHAHKHSKYFSDMYISALFELNSLSPINGVTLTLK